MSLISDSRVLDSGGTAIRAACGRMIRRMLWPKRMPMVVAASYWPRGTERIEPRMISAAYPPTLRLSAMQAAG